MLKTGALLAADILYLLLDLLDTMWLQVRLHLPLPHVILAFKLSRKKK
jgi:hypothetical protein